MQDAVSSIRGELSSLQAERAALSSDRARLLHHRDAVRRRCQQLTHRLGTVLPLPADLVQGLQDGVVGCGELGCGAQGAAEAEEEEAGADRLLRASLKIMEEVGGCDRRAGGRDRCGWA